METAMPPVPQFCLPDKSDIIRIARTSRNPQKGRGSQKLPEVELRIPDSDMVGPVKEVFRLNIYVMGVLEEVCQSW